MKKSLKDRLQKRYEDRDKGGSSRIQALDFSAYKNVSFWKPVANKNRINILPYTIKTKNHPLVRGKDAEIGEEDFVLEVYIHQYVGPANSDILCLKKNFYKPCPICEQGEKFRDEGRKNEADKCNPSRRVYYNIVDEQDRDKGVQVWQASYKNFHKELMDEAGESGKNGEVLDFIDFKNGKVVRFRAEEATYNKNKYFEFRSFKFEDRDEPLDKALKDQIVSLDECMVIKSYEEIQKIFYGEDEDYSDSAESDDDEEEEVEEPVKNTSKPTKKEPEDDEEEEEGEPPKKAKKPAVKDEEEDAPPVKKNKKEPEPKEEEEKPKKKAAKKADEDEDDDEGFAIAAAKKADKTAKCPHGHIFGEECEDSDDCDDCEKWSECYKAKKALTGKK